MAENISFRSAVGGFNRNEVIDYIRKLLEENHALKEENITLVSSLAEKEQALSLQAQTLAEKEKKNEEQDAARLGAAMLEAKRFSDQLMSEANDRVEQLFDEVSQVADDSAYRLQGLVGQMDALSAEIHTSMTALSEKLAALEQVLGGFGGEALSASRQLRRQFEEEMAKTYSKEEISAPTEETAQTAEETKSSAGVHAKPQRVRIVKK